MTLYMVLFIVLLELMLPAFADARFRAWSLSPRIDLRSVSSPWERLYS